MNAPSTRMGTPSVVALPPLPEQIACVKRELGMREHVYPRRVSDGRMAQADANRELLTMRAVLVTLETLHRERNPELFA
jgi:hypothetical protein